MKSFSTFLSVITVLCLVAGTSYATEKLVISGNVNAPPVTWEENKQLTGISIDIISEILYELQIPHTFTIVGNWETTLDKAKNGEVDILVAAFKNDARSEDFLFSKPYLKEPTVIITMKGNEFPFNSPEDLIGRRGVSNVGESYGHTFDNYIKQNLKVKYVAFERAINLLSQGEADYLIADLYTALIYAKMLNGENAISILPTYAANESFCIAIAKTSPFAHLLPEINDTLQKIIDRNEVARLFYKHYEYWAVLSAKRSSLASNNTSSTKYEKIEGAPRTTWEVQERKQLEEIWGSRYGELPYSAR